MRNHTDIKRTISQILIAFCFFPYLRIIPLHLDAQPNALITGCLCIAIMGERKFNIENTWLLFVLLSAVCIMILSSPDAVGLRILTNYLSLFIIAYASFLSIRYCGGIPYWLFELSISIWFFVGLVQYFINPNFLNFLMLRGDGSMEYGRGVTSLAVEPTFYGMICIFFMIINYLNFGNRNHFRLLTLVLIMQLLMSKSTTCFIALFIGLSSYCIYAILKTKHGKFYIAIIVMVFVFSDYIIQSYVSTSNSRLAYAIMYGYENPELFITMDFSVNNRFIQSFLTIFGFIYDSGMPHGFGHLGEFLSRMEDNGFSDLFIYDVSRETKTSTALGGPLFELGIFALPIFIIILRCLKTIKRTGLNVVLIGCVLFSLMLNTMNYNQAIIPFIIGNLIYLKYDISRSCKYRGPHIQYG